MRRLPERVTGARHRAGGERRHSGRHARRPRTASRRTAIVLTAAMGLLLGGLPMALGAVGPDDETLGPVAVGDPGRSEDELVLNSSFENGLEGWRVNDPASQGLEIDDRARSGERSVRLSTTRWGTAVVNDRQNTVRSARGGSSYRAEARVRADGSTRIGQLRVREVVGGRLVERHAAPFLVGTQWQQVGVDIEDVGAGATLDVNVLAWNVGKAQALLVDDVSLVQTDAGTGPEPRPSPSATRPTPSPTPSETPPSDTTPTPAPTETSPTIPPPSYGRCVSDPRGLPGVGRAFVGATVSGSSTPEAREVQLGASLGLHRTYYSPSNWASAARQVRVDRAAGRMSWVSFKLPYSWTDMADGRGDAWVRDVVDSLAATRSPVWVAFHHEPEGDGDVREWRRMQAHLAPIVKERSDNIAFSIIVMGWHQLHGAREYSLESLWPGDGVVDIVGLDPYNWYGQIKNGRPVTAFDEMKPYYRHFGAFARAHGVRWAVAETGFSNEAAARDPQWLARAWRDLLAEGGIGLAYFDSTYNTLGVSWLLGDPVKQRALGALLPHSARLCP